VIGASTAAGSPEPMDATCRVAIVATGVFVVAQVAADIHPSGAVLAVAVGWSLLCFVAGSVAFLWAIVVAAGRSRDEEVTLAGLVWLTGSAPAPVARVLRAAVITQTVVAFVTAGVRPFTALAFGILAPMFGLGCLAWWAARHGRFAAIAPGEGARHPDDRRIPAAPPAPASSSRANQPKPPDRAGPDVPDERAQTRVDKADTDDFDQLFRRRRKR
jgi:hypothetical protein